jgi:allantoin racemase
MIMSIKKYLSSTIFLHMVVIMRICVVIPILQNDYFEEITEKEFKAYARPGTEIFSTPWTLKKVKRAEKEGYDAVIIDCMGDPALHAARELVDIPVLGPAEASMAMASIIGHKFSVVTVLQSVVPIFHRMVASYGFKERFASVRSIDIPVLELDREDEVKEGLATESRKAIDEEGADLIILGCTGMIGMAQELQKKLGIPVIDPTAAALKMAESIVDLGLSHSKLVYPKPSDKLRKM